ncbi:hypothetical protein NUW58_g8359 [Xylaria curta]|uniref:Uncharacterized protein n=1 Tax=Xylaria curta TaxID=42375 RepID=A0ACC1N9X9_9PEZI|nr:hypothetical protein NUW58_g8359 [Xylaria curta]
MYTQEIRLPELEGVWKWPRLVNPHLADVGAECLDWATSFEAFTPEAQNLVHNKGKLNLLSAMCYPRMTKGGRFRAELQEPSICSFDDHANRATTWEAYVNSVAKQAELRFNACIPDLATYFRVRRNTCGGPSTIAFYGMDMDIPDDIIDHPIICELEVLAVDLVIIKSDILSYNKEQAVGDDEHNIITVIMREFDLNVQEAFNEAGKLSNMKIDGFYHLCHSLPQWIGPVNLDVHQLIDCMAQCVSGVMHWSYESQTYFGKGGLRIKKTRLMQLLPKVEQIST